MTPELPLAPCNAPVASAAATCTTSSLSDSASAYAHAERMVNSMFVPVSASATGNTLSRLISSVCEMRSPTAVCAQSRRAEASSRRADIQTLPARRAAVGASLATLADRLGTTFLPVDAFLVFPVPAGILVRLSGRPAASRGQDPDPQVLIRGVL